jgi:hypothetical protein
MKKIIAVLFLFSFSSLNVLAQDPDMMKAWQEYMTPGEMHKLLSDGVGEWKCTVSMWMDPSQPPNVSEGTAVTESLLGGRYFQTKFTGNYMGMPMNGIAVDGFDNAKKIFFSTWIDNFGTGIMYLEGKYDAVTKTTLLEGKMTNPMGIEEKVKETIKYIDKNNAIMEMFMVQDGKEIKSMEIKYTRVK